jgi:uncharacterized protein (DUF427 family)
MVQSTAYAANPGHKITVAPFQGRVVVTFKGAVVADTVKALSLKEASYPVTLYIPRADCKMVHFIESPLTTKCPFKGSARYWSLSSKDGNSENAVWGYDNPFDQVAEIDGHVAFYPDRVDIRAGGA